ncbi:MAG TPA: hypothetical protein VL400_08725, partial [Polyangiaceae bacterium]|nr:hypothetical protein [Polyangiaceae bacterium]
MRRSSGFGGRLHPLVIALAALLIAVSAAGRARGDEERSIVVLLEPEQPNDAAKETITRAKSELLAAGFDVQLSKKRGADTRDALATAMTEAHAVAAIAIEPAPGSSMVEVWVNDGLT